jgi:diaminopimelate epimerase
MRLKFHKYHGTGNDFIMIDDRSGAVPPDFTGLIPGLCHRHFGIGADGVILLRAHPDADFEMVYYNPDGSQSLCGNGSRCAVAFAKQLGIFTGDSCQFMAYDGLHFAHIEGEQVHFKLSDNQNLERLEQDFFVDTGSPHYVKIVEDLEQHPVVVEGRQLRNTPRFLPGGTNVNFITLDKSKNAFHIRTYERGVEDETLSCGTGITAAALVAAQFGMQSPIAVHARGGDLQVAFQTTDGHFFTELFLIGPARMVFAGEIDIHQRK